MINHSARTKAIATLIAVLLFGCESNDLWKPIPAFGGGGGGGSSWQPNPPPWAAKPAPKPSTAVTPSPLTPGARTGALLSTDDPVGDEPIKGQRELHGATSASGCYKMAERFKREGRRVKLVRIKPNTSDGILTTVCIFEGEDADPSHYATYGNEQ